jgi:hypothetical protein
VPGVDRSHLLVSWRSASFIVWPAAPWGFTVLRFRAIEAEDDEILVLQGDMMQP